MFVSYKKEDRAIAERLVAALRAAGKSVWWDDALNPNQAWDAMIEAEIAASKHVIVLWTPRSVQSDWVRSEAHYAQDHGKLVPVMIERCSLPIAFMLRQAVDLSSGQFDDGNPQWRRLIGWLEGAVPEAAPGPVEREAAARAAAPVKALTGERWLGPARRPSLAIGGAAAMVVALLAALFLFRADLGFGAPPQPDVVVDPLTATNPGALPPGFAKAVSDEMFAGFSSSSRISPVQGDGARRPKAYQLTGDIAPGGDTIRVFAKLFAPRLDAPVMTIKLEHPASDKAAAQEFGLELAKLTRCVATASDSIGSKLTTLPAEAFGPWAKFCQQDIIGPSTPESNAATLRSVVAAAPDFANGWSNLAEALFTSAMSPGGDKAALLAEADKAADRALALDPKTAKALVVKSWGVIGLAGPATGGTALGKLHNFPQWEALALKSIRVRPSDCGCEVPQYAGLLMMFGRASAALPLMEQAVTTDPTAQGHAMMLADLVAQTGRPGEGDKALADLAEQWPDSKAVGRHRFVQALWRKDWPAARQYLDSLPNGPDRQAFPPLLDTLARGDAAAARKAGAPFLAINASRETMSPFAINALALAGYTDETADALETAVSKGDMTNIIVAFEPPFAAVRKTAAFAALAAKMGLVDYWRMPGHRPDFCGEPDPAAFCSTLSKT